MPGATYSPQMIEKSDSTSLALATIAVLGQAPRHGMCGVRKHACLTVAIWRRFTHDQDLPLHLKTCNQLNSIRNIKVVENLLM